MKLILFSTKRNLISPQKKVYVKLCTCLNGCIQASLVGQFIFAPEHVTVILLFIFALLYSRS